MEETRPISKLIAGMILSGREHHTLTIRECIDMLEGKSIVLILLPFCLINSFPMPSIPGFSTITGIPIIILGFHMLCGSETFWLPRRIGDRAISPGKWVSGLKRLLPYVKYMEEILKPRWEYLSSPVAQQAFGTVFVVLGIILALPLPFTNFPVGFALSLLAFGLILRDGVLIVFALVLAAALIGGGWFMLDALAG